MPTPPTYDVPRHAWPTTADAPWAAPSSGRRFWSAGRDSSSPRAPGPSSSSSRSPASSWPRHRARRSVSASPPSACSWWSAVSGPSPSPRRDFVMSTCTKWVARFVITCQNWGTRVDHVCTTWADEGSQKCSDWADEGSNACSRWADEGSDKCSSWEKDCHWYTFWNCVIEWVCVGWYWVANWVCQAWYWVAKWVCKAWYWVAKWVCKVFAWVVKAVCLVFSWVMQLVCVAWDWLRCAILAIIGFLFGGRSDPPVVDKIFVLMLENRSFDHVFGLSGMRGHTPDGAPTVINGAPVGSHSNVDPFDGTSYAVSGGADFSLKGVDADPGHEFEN